MITKKDLDNLAEEINKPLMPKGTCQLCNESCFFLYAFEEEVYCSSCLQKKVKEKWKKVQT